MDALAGTAILSKTEPISVDYTLPGHPEADSVKGRIVTLEYQNMYVIGTYVVNAGTALKVPADFELPVNKMTHSSTQTLDAKKLWNEHFETYIRTLDAKKPVIWTGDLNVAPTEMGMSCSCRCTCHDEFSSLHYRSKASKAQLEQNTRVHGSRDQLFRSNSESTKGACGREAVRGRMEKAAS